MKIIVNVAPINRLTKCTFGGGFGLTTAAFHTNVLYVQYNMPPYSIYHLPFTKYILCLAIYTRVYIKTGAVCANAKSVI